MLIKNKYSLCRRNIDNSQFIAINRIVSKETKIQTARKDRKKNLSVII